jgi:hypothetical protein
LFLTGTKAQVAEGGITIMLSDKSGVVIMLYFRFHLYLQLTWYKLIPTSEELNFAGPIET